MVDRATNVRALPLSRGSRRNGGIAMSRCYPRASLLIIDDDPALVRLVNKVLESTFAETLSITALTDPLQAARYLEDSICDILLSDISMPDIGGLELLRQAKARNAWTQVIFMTGHSTWLHVSEAMGNGASDYLLKPVDRQQLEKVVGEAVTRMQRWQYALRRSLPTAVGTESATTALR
jgi:DNA-binding NtrC family response regulator